MASKKKKNKQPHVQCSWVECRVKCISNRQLNEHVTKHLEIVRKDFSGFYKCVWGPCDFTTKCLIEFSRHNYYHAYYNALLAQGQYECDKKPNIPKCNAPARTSDKIPDLKENFRCNWKDCNSTYVSIVEFQDHIEQHASFEYEIQKTPDDERPRVQCNWNFCKKQLENKYRLFEHISTHSNKKQVACNHCGELFRTKTTLFDHLRRQENNNTNKFQCAQCFKFFAIEKLFRSHVVTHVNCYKCTMCDMTCSSASSLTTHIRYRHLKDRPFQCMQCDQRCVRESDLKQHIKLVHQRAVYSCNDHGCNYTVRTKQSLKRHILEVHKNMPLIYICHCCDKSFKNGKSLSAHLIKKHNYILPSGHKRFTYRIDESGFYRLETMRIESQEVTEQIQASNAFDKSKITSDGNCFTIISMKGRDNIERLVMSSSESETLPTTEIIISLPTLDIF